MRKALLWSLALMLTLTLPPRRFVPQELPVGGYTDIVTRGQIEHLLPTQFALDELEFLRRFAENELLYFRREEPPKHHRLILREHKDVADSPGRQERANDRNHAGKRAQHRELRVGGSGVLNNSAGNRRSQP